MVKRSWSNHLETTVFISDVPSAVISYQWSWLKPKKKPHWMAQLTCEPFKNWLYLQTLGVDEITPRSGIPWWHAYCSLSVCIISFPCLAQHKVLLQNYSGAARAFCTAELLGNINKEQWEQKSGLRPSLQGTTVCRRVRYPDVLVSKPCIPGQKA